MNYSSSTKYRIKKKKKKKTTSDSVPLRVLSTVISSVVAVVVVVVVVVCCCCLFVGCLTSQPHAGVSQGRTCSDSFMCCHTEIEVADPTFHLT